MPQLRVIALCIALFTLSTPAFAELKKLVILHTNDFHGHIAEENEYAGAAKIAAYVKQVREAHEGVLVLDGGDRVSGTPVSTMFKGVPIFEVLNEVGYDAAVLGNHEFDHGYKQMLKFKEIADYPLLAANAFAPDGSLLADAPSLIKTVNGIKIGIIGLITEATPFMIIPTGNEGISFAPALEMLQPMVTAMRPNVDLLIVLSHVGHEEEVALAKAVDGIDIIVGGHSHTTVLPPVLVGDTYVAQAGFYGAYVGKIEVTVDTEKDMMKTFNGTLVPSSELPKPLKRVDKMVKRWEAKVADKVDFKISTAKRDYSKFEMQPFLQEILADATGADFGFYNMGGIRDVFRKGPVTARHIWGIEPFSNQLVTVTAKGSVIKKMIGREESQASRVAALKDDQTYTVATSDYSAAQAEKRYGEAISTRMQGMLVRDVLIEYISKHGLHIGN